MLCSLTELGLGVRDAAKPAPIPGCSIKNGATTVAMPTASAGPIEGVSIHAFPQMAINNAA
ncbi:hypothetical protein GCM10007391_03810 [Alteromonas halophila]|uniref:Uncharacterized protein n=1 Tax=Alteromonas halophila TaxID=516698 RepID=A0A918JE29_9ALTE|nr:hypothetical protein GCM10007391_03810 [Alteromonas halophila]